MARGYDELTRRMPPVKKLLDTGSSEDLRELYKQVSVLNFYRTNTLMTRPHSKAAHWV